MNPCARTDTACKKKPCATPTIGALLSEHSPDVTVVSLGGNSMFRGSRRDQWAKVAPWVELISRAIYASGSQCLWVTPPHGMNKSPRKMAQFRDFVVETTHGMCDIYDSTPRARPYLNFLTTAREARRDPTKTDGIHYDRLGKAGRKRMRRWAASIADTVIAQWQAGLPEPTWLQGVRGDVIDWLGEARTADQLSELRTEVAPGTTTTGRPDRQSAAL